MKRIYYLIFLLLVAGLMPTIDTAAAECQQWTAVGDAHVAAGRAYVNATTIGCLEISAYYAVGSDESLGSNKETGITLYSDDNGQSYHLGTCPIGGTDADEDGFTAGADCNDNDSAIHPGAEDICGDNIDQDCDGSDAACPSNECLDWTDTNAAHVSANRAYTETVSSGCSERTNYYAVGSKETMGFLATANRTLYSDDGGKSYHLGSCPVAGKDEDGDGYASDVDCNDNDAAIHPDATEICGDNIDQDCSGGDLACPSEEDNDQDGYPSGQDCNDNDPSIHPGAEDICGDNIDQDCSGGDLACPSEEDNDQDGYTSGQDCDDDNSGIHPGAMDYCGDGIDQDCSGADSECLPPPSCITSLDNWKVKYAPRNSNCRSCHTSCTPGGLGGRHGCTEGEAWGSMTCTACHSSVH